MSKVPEKPSLSGLEAKWDARWTDDETYRFDRAKQRAEVYAIDTPPPTVSGSLHLGSAFGYIQTDAVARFRRMHGAEVAIGVGDMFGGSTGGGGTTMGGAAAVGAARSKETSFACGPGAIPARRSSSVGTAASSG